MNSKKTCYCVNQWLIDTHSGAIIHRQTGEQKRLGEYQLKLLELLAQHAGEVLSREQLTALVWEGRVIGNNSLPNAIHALRLALEDNGKNQRIIKTVPKRGYLLEKEYCAYVDGHIQDAGLKPPKKGIETHSALSVINLRHNEDYIDLSASMLTDKTHFSANDVNRHWYVRQYLKQRNIIVYSVLALCLIALGALSFLYFNNDTTSLGNAYRIKQEQSTELKNIQVYYVYRNDPTLGEVRDPDKILARLTPALREIDRQLEELHGKMYVYFRAANSTLNYAFTVETPCARKKLSMNIYHWRINNDRVNDLIRDETERKLNETANCID